MQPTYPDDDFITIVSGLPRSGTSMMMRMLEAGGMPIVVDNIRRADEDNPRGYYEFEQVKKLAQETSWLNQTKGKAFKMVSMLLYQLPLDNNYRVIFMTRDMNEILASQRAMLTRSGKVNNDFDEEEKKILLTKHLKEIKNWLDNQEAIKWLSISYNEFINAPKRNTDAVNLFLNNIVDTGEMITVIDKNLYRQRK